MSLYFLTCFHSLFSHCNSLGIYLENIFISIYRWILRVHIQLEKFIAIYRHNIFVDVSLSIFWWCNHYQNTR
jgi:hypothetical protein